MLKSVDCIDHCCVGRKTVRVLFVTSRGHVALAILRGGWSQRLWSLQQPLARVLGEVVVRLVVLLLRREQKPASSERLDSPLVWCMYDVKIR